MLRLGASCLDEPGRYLPPAAPLPGAPPHLRHGGRLLYADEGWLRPLVGHAAEDFLQRGGQSLLPPPRRDVEAVAGFAMEMLAPWTHSSPDAAQQAAAASAPLTSEEAEAAADAADEAEAAADGDVADELPPQPAADVADEQPPPPTAPPVPPPRQAPVPGVQQRRLPGCTAAVMRAASGAT